MEKCKICEKEFKSIISLISHFTKIHKLSSKEYYNKFFKQDNDGLCKTCGKETKFYSLSGGYAQYCCRTCADKSPEKHKKASETKTKNGSNEKMIKKIKLTKLERYGNENYNNSLKNKQTCLNKYGVDNYRKSEKFKEHSKKIRKEKYGNENYNNREKAKETCLDKYGVEVPNCFGTEEFKQSMNKKYGVDNPLKIDNIKEQVSVKNTANAQERIEKAIKTNLNKYGVKNVTQSNIVKEKIRETNQSKRNVDCSFQSEEVKSKIRKTMIERYGVEHYAQSEEFHKNKLSKYFYDNIILDSSYELCFYKYCKDNNILIKKCDTSFEYTYENTVHKYFPDFKINDRFIEIKGQHFFENGKMINPFDRTQDGLYEAKHQCMLSNNIEIISDCNKYIDYVLTVDPSFVAKCEIGREITLDTLSWKELTSGKQRCIDIAKKANGNTFYKRELQLWKENKHLHKELFENRLKYINKNPNELSDLEIIRGLNISGKIRAYSTFDNSGLKEFLHKYNIQSIYDPCAGWGERLATCASLGVKYFGIDINEEVVDGQNKIINNYNLNRENYRVSHADSSKYKNDETFDATFTCPPYWNEEIYTEQGAENMSYDEFLCWWKSVIKNCGTNIFAYQINQKYKNDMNNILIKCGYQLKEEICLKSQSSHFTRDKNNINRKKEYESIQIFIK